LILPSRDHIWSFGLEEYSFGLTAERKAFAYRSDCSKGLLRFLPRLAQLQMSKDPGEAAAGPVQTDLGR